VKVLIAVKGNEDEAFFRQVATLAPLAQADAILLVHVIDTAPRADLERGRDRFLGRRPVRAEQSTELDDVEADHARALLQHARGVLISLGLPDDRVHEIVLRGRPKDELRSVAEREQVNLVVVRGRPGKPGPHSLGKTARFLIDHCPEAALLIR
jgi:nucleotide-binding universal stress UspA family protein